jgi:hypothetical protein
MAREAAKKAALGGVEVITGDASIPSAYDGAVPADLVLVCGVFGNITGCRQSLTKHGFFLIRIERYFVPRTK